MRKETRNKISVILAISMVIIMIVTLIPMIF